jgi:hypothetical protein
MPLTFDISEICHVREGTWYSNLAWSREICRNRSWITTVVVRTASRSLGSMDRCALAPSTTQSVVQLGGASRQYLKVYFDLLAPCTSRVSPLVISVGVLVGTRLSFSQSGLVLRLVTVAPVRSPKSIWACILDTALSSMTTSQPSFALFRERTE